MEMKEKRNSEISVGDTEDLFKRIGTEDFVQISWRFLV